MTEILSGLTFGIKSDRFSMNKDDFGIKGVIANYSSEGLIKDLWLPILCGFGFASFQCLYKDSLEDNLNKLLDYAIVYLPVMATIILTAYTMMIGALKSSLDVNRVLNDLKKKGDIENEEETKSDIETLRTSISASFAASILISIIALGGCWIIYFIKGFQIVSQFAFEINLICYGLIIAMIIYPIIAIIGIVSDMFSISRI